ncbi:hypothetical protein [Bradyrhizobium sp.]|uniref:hypothetical protein n=1 Tax=Bradyrhizobium sp. TaxID=376 RepID=UPI00391ADC8B
MVDDSVASTIPDQAARRPKTPAERQRAYRQRKRQRQIAAASAPAAPATEILPPHQPVTSAVGLPVTSNVTVSPPAFPVTPVTLAVTVPLCADVTHVTEPHSQATNRRPISSHGLTVAALLLAAVGITMNGWFAQTLGSTDFAGTLFLAIGVASDLVALAGPPTAILVWLARRRATAVIAWLVWFATFVFAVTSGIGFASVNIADVTLTRASRVTPSVTIAQDALRDAVASRNRECAGGVGRFCREREQAVADRQRALDSALGAVEHAADPQTDAAAKIVAWLSGGAAKPEADAFAMLRLILLALLPQIGGILLMIGRSR